MKNIDLNIGGLVGAIACGAIAAVIMFGMVEIDDHERGPYRLIIGALIAGAFAGNFLWGKLFGKK